MSAANRPVISSSTASVTYDANFTITTSARVRGAVQAMLVAPGFHTHGVAMGQRMIEMQASPVTNSNSWTVLAPPNSTVIAPGVHLLFIVRDGVPSAGKWLKLA